MAKDPVCGMDVEERNAAAKAQFQGKTYQFCSTDCQKKFDQNPEQYAKAA
jgi:Cu+-exporting ATPase